MVVVVVLLLLLQMWRGVSVNSGNLNIAATVGLSEPRLLRKRQHHQARPWVRVSALSTTILSAVALIDEPCFLVRLLHYTDKARPQAAQHTPHVA